MGIGRICRSKGYIAGDILAMPAGFIGGMMLIVFGCIIYAIVQQMWPSAFILIAMEACIIMVTFGAGLLEGLLQIAQESLGGFMKL